MGKLKSWISVIAAIVVFALAAIVAFVLTRKDGKSIARQDGISSRAASFSASAREKVNIAMTGLAVEKEISKATTDRDRKKLERIKAETDDKTRRRKLAVFIQERL